MCGAIPPLPQYASMAWCSVKKSTETTLPLPPFYPRQKPQSLILRGTYELKVSVHEVHTVICIPKVRMGDWIKLHIEELGNI
jgi:hypothetical protein